MTQMKVVSLTTLRMEMVQDMAEDMVVMVEVTAVDVAMVAMATAPTQVEAPPPLVIQALLRAGPTHRLMVTWMTMLNSYMIT